MLDAIVIKPYLPAGPKAASVPSACCTPSTNVGDAIPKKSKKSWDAFQVIDDRSRTTGIHDAPDQNNSQSSNHDDALHKVGDTLRQKSADERVEHDEHRSGNHNRDVRHFEQGCEELSYRHKTAGCIDRKEDENERRRYRQNNALVLMEPIAEEFRQGDCFR